MSRPRRTVSSSEAVSYLKASTAAPAMLPVAELAMRAAERMGVVWSDVPFAILESVRRRIDGGAWEAPPYEVAPTAPPLASRRGQAAGPLGEAVWSWAYLSARSMASLAEVHGARGPAADRRAVDEANRVRLYAFCALVASGEPEPAAEAMVSSAMEAAGPRRRDNPPGGAHSLALIHSVSRAESVRVLLPLVELAVSEADRAVGMTDDRPHMVISTLRRFVSGELTRAEAQRELGALKLRDGEPRGEWGGGAAQAPYFAYGAARHLAEVFRRSAKAADERRLANEKIWTRFEVDLVLRRLGETEESSEAIMRNVLGKEIGEAR